MKLLELFESISREVYHYTRLGPAATIVSSGEFKLGSSIGNKQEEKFAPKGYPYFLSTSRSKVGGYHKDPGPDAVLFVLDGNWYNAKYKGGPVDYWGDRHNQYGRTSEAEDRIFSKEPNIPIDGVTAIHIYLNPSKDRAYAYTAQYARKLMVDAKVKGIPTYLYNDPAAWLHQRTNKATPVKELAHILRDPIQIPRHTKPSQYNTLGNWLELITKSGSNQLTDKANKMASSISYSPSYNEQEDYGLGTDMANARKPDSHNRPEVEKIIRVMKAHSWNSTTDIYRAMKEKWAAIKKSEYEKEQQTRG